MVVVMMMAGHRLRQILDVRQLAALGGIRKVCGQLIELVGRTGVSTRLGALGGALQIGGDLLGELLVLVGVGLLELLERVEQLGKWRELAIVRLLRTRG